MLPAVERRRVALLAFRQFLFLREEKLVPGGVTVLVNLLRYQLDAGDATDEGGKAGRPMGGAVEFDAPAFLQIALPERHALLLLPLENSCRACALPVGQPLRLLLHVPAARLLAAPQFLAALLLDGFAGGAFLVLAEQLHRGAVRGCQRPRLVHGRQGVRSDSPCRGIRGDV